MTVAQFTDTADGALIALFIEDAAQNGSLLWAGLSTLCSGTSDDASLLPELCSAAQSAKSAARIVECTPVASLAEGLERALRRLQDAGPPFPADFCSALLASAQLLVELGKITAPHLGSWLEEHDAELRHAVQGMKLGRAPGPVPQVEAAAPRVRMPAISIMPAPDATILALFRTEAEACTATLSRGLVQLETGGSEVLEELMRAAHSLKGAARVVGIDLATRVAHALEECFVAAQRSALDLRAQNVDALLAAVDLLSELSQCTAQGLTRWQEQRSAAASQIIANLEALARGELVQPMQERITVDQYVLPVLAAAQSVTPHSSSAAELELPSGNKAVARQEANQDERVVKVAAGSIARLMGLAGELLVESRRVQVLDGALKQLKSRQGQLAEMLEELAAVPMVSTVPRGAALLGEVAAKALECRTLLAQEIADMDAYARRVDDLSERLYREAQKSRMRPFGDCVHGLPRMMRDVARKLGKQSKLHVVGESTHVDRDVLESLDAPLNHLLRNALDHGVEAPEARVLRGKSPEALIRLEARHHAGMLSITITDDGRGIDPEALRARIVDKGLLKADLAAALGVPELMEFIFLPGFSTAAQVTEISGRGVGLDAVRTAIQAASGTVRVTSEVGRGTTFHLELPVTRSVLRAVVTEVDGEAYAFPLLRIERILRIQESEVCSLGNVQFFVLHEANVALISARQILGLGAEGPRKKVLCVVVLGVGNHRYGLVVDKFIGEHDLVVRPLDRRLGKVQNIAAAAILMDGAPALIFDTDDLVRSIEKLAQSGRIEQLAASDGSQRPARKRILVVDDSIVVREAERQLLANNGYDVDVAVDGIDGWNSLRNGSYDLVVSDVDMPRMNGLELVRTMRREPKFEAVPIIIVSYKDRPEDRLSGLEAGANCYLTKSSFHDETLVEAVDDLIGKGDL